MSSSAASLDELPGMWRRVLIIRADGTRDTRAQVRWLQARSLYVDLRQDASMPDFLHVKCLNDLARQDCAQLAIQEGFAGRLTHDGECYEWQRLIDFQPRGAVGDIGRLWWEEDLLIEAGRDVPYVEHWQRDPTVVTRPLAALRLRDRETGALAQAVQSGTVFMFARDRITALPSGRSLAECVAGAASIEQARALLDCEVSLGSVGFAAGAPSLILASTHPWRVSEPFVLSCLATGATSTGVDDAGRVLVRYWEVIESEGDPEAVWPATSS